MTRNKIQRMLNKLDGRNEATMKVVADFDAGVKALRDKLEQDISIATLEEVKVHIAKLRKAINIEPLITQVGELKSDFKANALTTLQEIEDKTNELKTMIAVGDEALNQKIIPLSNRTDIFEKGFNAFTKLSSEDFLKVNKSISVIREGVLADNKETKETFVEVRKEIKEGDEKGKDYTDKIKRELMNTLSERGGGNMNRQIFVGGANPLTKYTDINLKAGAGTTITYANNNTTKKVDITITATGGGSGITRTIVSVAVDTAADATAGIDYVYLVSGTTTITLPDATTNTNLYTIKNVGSGVVTIATTSSQTIDGSSTITMPVQYTSVDLISDTANWNVT